jgi:hypothetical protein
MCVSRWKIRAGFSAMLYTGPTQSSSNSSHGILHEEGSKQHEGHSDSAHASFPTKVFTERNGVGNNRWQSLWRFSDHTEYSYNRRWRNAECKEERGLEICRFDFLIGFSVDPFSMLDACSDLVKSPIPGCWVDRGAKTS